MILGQHMHMHMHEMESYIEVVLDSGTPSRHTIDELFEHHALGVQMFDNLRKPQAAEIVAPQGGSIVVSVDYSESTVRVAAEPDAGHASNSVPSLMPPMPSGLTARSGSVCE